jgi:hypothetical protein
MFDKILSFFSGNAVKDIGNVVDGLTTSDDEKNKAKAQLSEIVLNSLNSVTEAQADVLKTEMQGNWLQRSWRPLVMIAFVVLLIIRWTGISTHHIDLSLEMQLMEIIKLGLGGYVVGRSVEKVATTVTQNIDMPFLKKKDRK